MEVFLEPFSFAFMQRAFVVAILAALLCGLISCWLVLIGWSLMGDAVSHAVFPGVVLSYILGWPFAVGAFIAGFIAVQAIGAVRNSPKIKEDGAIGVVFTSMFALGLVVFSIIPNKANLTNILFGSIISITPLDLIQVSSLSAIGLVMLIYKRRDLTLFVFDPAHANAIGISTRRLQILLLSMLALTVVTSLQAIGVIMVVAMLITPGVTSSLLTRKINRMLIISPALSVGSAAAGLYLSYILNVSPGGMIVMILGVIFAFVYVFSIIRARRNTAAQSRAKKKNKVLVIG